MRAEIRHSSCFAELNYVYIRNFVWEIPKFAEYVAGNICLADSQRLKLRCIWV